ncbi:hypothetical protein AMECASPLE_031989 [Ameca splendens]|uniref:Uncharacterized protein n=1 Tax=Ameca splendens TaxID=208324 RepID=A0ABV0ZHQ2_9TELE
MNAEKEAVRTGTGETRRIGRTRRRIHAHSDNLHSRDEGLSDGLKKMKVVMQVQLQTALQEQRSTDGTTPFRADYSVHRQMFCCISNGPLHPVVVGLSL